jgi:hypothetical protein
MAKGCARSRRDSKCCSRRHGPSSRTAAGGAHDHHKYVNTTTQYEKQIAYLRELLDHTFLRAVYHTSTKQARLEYKQVQETFLNKNARRAANKIPCHIAPNCPDKAANKQKAQSKLFKTKTNKPAPRALLRHGICHRPFAFDHRCNPEDKCINKNFDTVKSKLRQSSLLKLTREAHEGTDHESSSTDNVLPISMNHSYFVGDDEGQQDDNLDHPQDHSADEEGERIPPPNKVTYKMMPKAHTSHTKILGATMTRTQVHTNPTPALPTDNQQRRLAKTM